MDLGTFKASLSHNEPPGQVSSCLKALWHDANGNWEMAHEIIQDLKDQNAAWIHAYLHRKEGDNGNADYWYRRAGKTRPASTLAAEWEQIAAALI